MNNSLKKMRRLVWISLSIMAIATVSVAYAKHSNLPPSIEIDTTGQPTIGYPSARVHVVVIEELKCTNCRTFSEEIFPKLKKNFIDTNKIRYTMIPVSFLPNSMPAANAALAVYRADPKYPNPELFFTYVDYLYIHQPKDESVNWATASTLINFAKHASPAINLDHLKTCIDQECYRIEIEKNTEYGNKIMDGKLSTPNVYVNGIKVEELTYDEIEELIIKVLAKQGVH